MIPLRIYGVMADRYGCGYYRIEQPLNELARRGAKVAWSTQWRADPTKRADDSNWRTPDVLLAQRTCLNGMSRAFVEYEGFKVYEVDDDLLNIDSSNARAYQLYGQRDIQRNIKACLGAADRVTVTTTALADRVSEYVKTTSSIHVIPNAIPTWLTEVPRQISGDGLTLGWAGSNTHQMDWGVCQDQIRRFCQRNNVGMHFIGANYGWEGSTFEPWKPKVQDYWRRLRFDIGLAPLRPHVFNRSKSWIKALEYAALGIPTVASDFGPYADFVLDGYSGFLVRRDHEWNLALKKLVDDDALRVKMSGAARAVARNHVIEGSIGDLWMKALTP